MGVVKDSLPPVPEDKEIRAKNRARNEEQKKAKEDKKAKAARKAQRREISAKNHREAEKAGVAPPPSPETSVSEIEGEGGNADWLDELAEEDDAIPPAGGGIEILEGPKAQGRYEAPEGSSPRGSPGEGEGVGGRIRGAPQLVAQEGVAEPRPAPGAGAGASVEVTQAETTVVVPAPSAGETGSGRWPLALREVPKEL